MWELYGRGVMTMVVVVPPLPPTEEVCLLPVVKIP